MLVRLKRGSASFSAASAAGRLPGVRLRRATALRGGGGFAAAAAAHNELLHLAITDGSSVEDKVQQLSALAAVHYAEPNWLRYVSPVAKPSDGVGGGPRSAARRRLQQLPNDPLLADPGAALYAWHLPRISAPSAWDRTVGSRLVKVCVVDSGVYIGHEDLAANVAQGWNMADANATYFGERSAACKGGGAAAGVPTARSRTHAAPPLPPPPCPAADDLGHGTHTAGIVGAVGNNSVGLSGVNWQVSLLICKFITA